jgi:phosphomannomutase
VLDPSVFKAYDVRGLYPSQLDEDGAYRVARAYTRHFEPRSVALGHDMRLSSPALAAAAAQGIADEGADVADLGLVGTEMLYHAVTELQLDGGICVTASHNPKEYTGMKIVRRGALPVGGDSGLAEIRAIAERHCGPHRAELISAWFALEPDSLRVARSTMRSAVRVHRRGERNGRRHAPAGSGAPPAARCRALLLDPDGTFPNHQPNPLLPENREFIVRKVARSRRPRRRV